MAKKYVLAISQASIISKQYTGKLPWGRVRNKLSTYLCRITGFSTGWPKSSWILSHCKKDSRL